MPNREEVLKALHTIKNVCVEQDHCDTCPLRDFDEDCYGGFGCILKTDKTPSEWKIKLQAETWRAFED